MGIRASIFQFYSRLELVSAKIISLTDIMMTELNHINKEYFEDGENELTKEQLEYALQLSFSPEILADPKGWTPEHPAFGHCSAVAQVVHDIFGGEIHGFWFVDEARKWGESVRGSHFLNLLPDGSRVDFTRSQFPIDFPYDEIMDPHKATVVNREETFGNAGSAGQYARLKIAITYNLWQSFGVKMDCPFLARSPWDDV